MNTIRNAAASRAVVMVVTALMSVVGTLLATAYPWVYEAVCAGLR